ncbi:MAG: OBG GTPase family GTP-binding protein [Candidatus Saliniplasma sp.]
MSNDLEEQIDEIEKEIRETPYNKATQQHIGRLKAKLSKLKDKLDREGEGTAEYGGYAIKKEGDATVALVGFPSSGKSTLINKLTGAKSEVANYEFTTLEVIPGILKYNDAVIQILDLPGLVEGASSGKGRGREVLSVARESDLILLMGDVYKDELEVMAEELESKGVRLNKEPPEIVITKKEKGGIEVRSTVELTKIDKETIKEILREYRYINANIVIRDDITVDELIDHLSGNRVYIPAVPIINKIDLEYHNKNISKIIEKWNPVYISATEGKGLDRLKKRIFEELNLIRVFLRPKGEKADDEPMILKRDSTIEDVCRKLHSDFREKFRYARIWGPTAKFPKQQVGMDHELKEGDTVRIITD